MLLSFLTKAYRSIVNLGCWIFAILLGIGMAIGFYEFFYDLEVLAAIGGFIVGFIIGLWFEINFVVPMTILFEINNKLDKIEKKLEKTNYNIQNLSLDSKSINNTVSKTNVNFVPKVDVSKANENLRGIWVCKDCGEENPDTQNSCKSCGKYR